MLTLEERRKGWCPGALSPMQAKDGLIVRLRISGGSLGAATLRRLAGAARACGNGLIDLSQRGNLQLRGVSRESLPPLLATLDALGLIDKDPRAEAIRNVMVSPLAGITGPVDVAPIGRALEAALVAATDLHSLPGKFGFLIDDDGPLPLADEPADVRFAYCASRQAFVISIGGAARDATCLGVCAANEIEEMALRLARAFLAVGRALPKRPRRMAELISAAGAASIAAAAGLSPGPAPEPNATGAPAPIGLATSAGVAFFGAAAPFGRLSAGMLDAAAEAAEVFGSGEIRLTPWRALILPRVDRTSAATLQRRLAAARFIVARDDPRLAVAACGGAPACGHATTQTHSDALALAEVARRIYSGGIVLHVSGCPKGCARPRPTAVTLVGNNGLYDLVVDGTPSGPSVAQNLTFAAAREALAALARGGKEGGKRASA